MTVRPNHVSRTRTDPCCPGAPLATASSCQMTLTARRSVPLRSEQSCSDRRAGNMSSRLRDGRQGGAGRTDRTGWSPPPFPPNG